MTYLTDTGLATFYAGLNAKFLQKDGSGLRLTDVVNVINGVHPDANGNVTLTLDDLQPEKEYFSYTVEVADWTGFENGERFTDYIAAADIGLSKVEIGDYVKITSIVRADDRDIVPSGGYYFGIGTFRHSTNLSDPQPDRVRFYNNLPAPPSYRWTIDGYVIHNTEGTNSDYYVVGKDSGYPVSSIYMSVHPTSPALLFGGTWEQISGRFLIGIGQNDVNTTNSWGSLEANTISFAEGERGGEPTHLLTGSEAAQKSLSIGGGSHAHPIGYRNLTGGSGSSSQRRGPYGNSSENTGTVNSLSSEHSHSVSASNASNAHNNMPPYLAVYIWKRIA